jgi:hypothetical protein
VEVVEVLEVVQLDEELEGCVLRRVDVLNTVSVTVTSLAVCPLR